MARRTLQWAICLVLAATLWSLSALAEAWPGDVALSRSGSTNTLTWQPVEGATRYAVYKSARPTGAFKPLAYTDKCTYAHMSAGEGVFYKLRPLMGKKKGAFSPVVGYVSAPSQLKVTKEGAAFVLSWKAAKFATAYQVQVSDSAEGPWQVLQPRTVQTSLDITGDATTARYYRVCSFFGETMGGFSGAAALFGPVSELRVVCEESFLTGPTDRINVQWSAAAGATAYEVYRATLPSAQYARVATTTQTYYPDQRMADALYAYKVRPLYGERAGALSPAVTLWSDVPDNVLPPDDLTSPTGILLLVNKKAQVTTAYVRDSSGKYTVALRHMLCSTGKVYERTATGAFSIQNKGGEWDRYPSGVYVRYPSVYRKGYYFHSPLYNAGKRVIAHTVSQLGTRRSLGCIRLKVNDAKWIYDACPVGTTVYICDGQKLPALVKAIKPRDVSVAGF